MRSYYAEQGQRAFSVSKTIVTNLNLVNLAFAQPRCYTLAGISAVLLQRFGTIMKVILNSRQIKETLNRLAGEIISAVDNAENIAVVGVRSRGEILAQRLAALLSDRINADVPCGTLDITLYRDDLNSPQGRSQPLVRTTEIGFNIDDKIIVLVDDVLYTGRSTRAAMDALIDLGRPSAIRLAVLVDRLGRELPIQADYVGCKADVKPQQSVKVSLVESDGKDEVVIE